MNTCGQESTQDFTITEQADASWAPIDLCTSSDPVDLNTLVTGDTNGTWTGTGVTGNIFDPAAAGAGTVTYTI